MKKKFDKSVLVIFLSKIVAYVVNIGIIMGVLALLGVVAYGFYLAFNAAGWG